MAFTLQSKYRPQGDQPKAIEQISSNLQSGHPHQTLLGVTGSGKTFTMASVIEETQRPTLIMSHNKTLAAQLYQEFKEFFPENEVHYFVSYYDYYQPESYMPTSDTYIEKEATINEQVERLRHAATQSLLSNSNTIVVSTVSCIYGIGAPEDYSNMAILIEVGQEMTRDQFITVLVAIQYTRNDIEFGAGSFRVKGDIVEIHSPGEEVIIKVSFWGNYIETIAYQPYEETPLQPLPAKYKDVLRIFPATHWISTREKIKQMIPRVMEEMKAQKEYFLRQNRQVEAQRIEERTKYDMEMLEEVGFVKGIENYSYYLSGRQRGEPPYTLIDYFAHIDPNFLTIIDESHITIPQVGGMYGGDASRKQNLIEHGFRLPSAADNRPLTFSEFEEKVGQRVYVSATPGPYEFRNSSNGELQKLADVKQADTLPDTVVEQVIRPTGLLEPPIEMRPTEDQVQDLIEEAEKVTAQGHRTLVVTLTKRMAEDISEFLQERGVRAEYLHSEIDTLERPKILNRLRKGEFDVLIGINLLREGLDLPEVSLVAILDADQEGFLRNETSLIQTIGRAARHEEGRVILYADKQTKSITNAMEETERRRKTQEDYNERHNISPKGVQKAIHPEMVEDKKEQLQEAKKEQRQNVDPDEKEAVIAQLEQEMKNASANLNFERAAELRDEIEELKKK